MLFHGVDVTVKPSIIRIGIVKNIHSPRHSNYAVSFTTHMAMTFGF